MLERMEAGARRRDDLSPFSEIEGMQSVCALQRNFPAQEPHELAKVGASRAWEVEEE